MRKSILHMQIIHEIPAKCICFDSMMQPLDVTYQLLTIFDGFKNNAACIDFGSKALDRFSDNKAQMSTKFTDSLLS